MAKTPVPEPVVVPTVTLVVLQPVQHDTDLYAEGESITLPEDQGAALVALGAAQAPAEPTT